MKFLATPLPAAFKVAEQQITFIIAKQIRRLIMLKTDIKTARSNRVLCTTWPSKPGLGFKRHPKSNAECFKQHFMALPLKQIELTLSLLWFKN